MSGLVIEEDARAMVRLVAEVAALRADHSTAKRHLMNGLKEIVGADCWTWALGYLHPDKPPVYVSLNHEGFTEESYAIYLQALEHPDMKVLTAPFAREVMAGDGLVTRLRQQIDGDSCFEETDAYVLWKAADIAPLILSAKPLNERCVSTIALYRRADRPLFDERERQIAHILLTEVPWLHASGWPEDFGVRTPSLSRKRRLVLNLLLEGYSRKIIADKLGLSIHTVSDYVKDIYGTFGVQSHAELMCRFTAGATRQE
jgi:DNA-binding NarL/FixJ family response regulator